MSAGLKKLLNHTALKEKSKGTKRQSEKPFGNKKATLGPLKQYVTYFY